MRKIGKVLLIILCVLLVFAIIIVSFLVLYKPFGGRPDKNDKEDYLSRSSNYKDGKFKNDDNFTIMGKYTDPFKDRVGSSDSTPSDAVDVENYEYVEPTSDSDVLITWFGHSTVLIQMHGMNVLVDPVFSNIASPVSLIGSKRFSDLSAEVSDLPNIDVILLTHDHYDHLDYKTIKAIDEKTGFYVVPLGLEKDLIKFGVKKSKIINLAWWEEVELNDLKFVCTPARHFSGRMLIDSNESLWSSWLIKDENHSIFDSGDSGYGKHFEEIEKKYGKVDFALIDSGQYNESWHQVHMFPEESVDAAIDLKADVAMPIHWGAFKLSNHPWNDPAYRFVRQAEELGVNYMVSKIGKTVNIDDYLDNQEVWWEE
ncbi:MAG: MBL fold metallo-hydrolase [Bacilli bacterium]|nr:MBL fold metallo-hydrolase [Bacilli bacterium]